MRRLLLEMFITMRHTAMRRYGMVFFALALLLIPTTFALTQGSLKLLAVSESESGVFGGSLANLHLEIRPGKGRVFIESFPASKIDTQLSTRFAKDVACKFLKSNCNKYDFFYTIKADSNLVGGPSAGAAATILTISVLNGITLNQSVAMTGTINSGGLIGPVGYVRTKIDAAAGNGITKVLIPYEQEVNGSNQTLDLVEYGKQNNITVVKVGDIDDALFEFTGKHFEQNGKNITIDPSYLETMRNLSVQLCERSLSLNKESKQETFPSTFTDDWADAINLTQQGTKLQEQGKYYSAASYCFGANVKYTMISLFREGLSEAKIEQMIYKTKERINQLNEKTGKQTVNTITDLETYMVVKDRLTDANDLLNQSLAGLEHNDTNTSISQLAFSMERLNSALSWTNFFNRKGKLFQFNQQTLKASCTDKIAEAEEHLQYLQLFFSGVLDSVESDLQRAYIDYARGNYELCLYKATIAKSEVNTILSTLGVEEQDVLELLNRKLTAAKKAIIEEQQRNIFPILGYSYYEYADALRKDNPYSALLYSEYALELSNLDIYFTPPNQSEGFAFDFTPISVSFIFLGGIFLGFAIGRAVYHKKQHDEKTQAKPHKEALPGKKR